MLSLMTIGHAAAAEGEDSHTIQEALSAIRADPPPKHLVRDAHYVVSNEHRHGQFRQSITDLGGLQYGVGTDQMYLMAGWSTPEALVLMDFDQMVVNLHKVYGIFFKHAANPESFLSLWSRENKANSIALLEARAEDPKALLKAFKYARKWVNARLKRVKKTYAKEKTPTFLSDADQYAMLRNMWLQGRVLAIRGNLTAEMTMADMAKAARAMNLPVRMAYLSNAEQYFEISDTYRKNIQSLPVDERSIYLRTFPNAKKDNKRRDQYSYYVQKATDFNTWLDCSRVKNTRRMRYYKERGKLDDLYILGPPPKGLRDGP